MSFLNAILTAKRDEIARAKAQLPHAQIERLAAARRDSPRGFAAALDAPGVRVIAELKRASPSRGDIRADLDPAATACAYADGGAAALSVLTEPAFFKGSAADLRQTRDATSLPVLRKDFIIDPYQVYESAALHADAILLIVAELAAAQLAELHGLAGELGMAALVEVHTADELDTALALRPGLVGINARNLHDFSVSLETTRDLARRVPRAVCLVAESGIHTADDVAWLGQAARADVGQGVDAILVGEALVTAPDVAAKVRELSSAGGT